MVVLDEAHKIKNTTGGITATSVMQLAEKGKARVVLTGTPAPNGYEDLANLFKFIWPTKNIIKFQTGQLKDMSKSSRDPRVKMLLDSLLPYFVRVKKSDLGIPPAINHPPIYVEMHESQKKIYEFIESKFVKDIAESRDCQFKKSLVKARLIRLMQAATNPELLTIPLAVFANEEGINLNEVSDDAEIIKKVMEYGIQETPAKFEVALDLIKDIIAKNGKVVVWACYIKTIELFRDFLQKNGISSRTLFGATPVAFDGMTEEDDGYSDTREAIIKEFHKSDSSFKVIIANPFAVAESISLHKACHNAIYLERSFNCAHFIQSKDRIHRYGLASGVDTHYYYLVSANTVDGVIDERLAEKEQRLLDIIESMPIPLFDNTMEDAGNEDIKAVLRDYAKRIKEV
jgi:SNF2 family DNA or RNA helicase